MKFEIVLVPFPFDDLTGVKPRPALCPTDSISFYKNVIVAFITSNILMATETSDIIIKTTDTDFELTGLKIDSAVRLHRVISIHQSLLLRSLGRLPGNLHNKVDQKSI